MPLTALALVLGAALLHATWNLAAKKAAHATHFMWLSASAAAMYLPVVGWILFTTRSHFTGVKGSSARPARWCTLL